MRSWMLCIELFKQSRAVNRLITAGNGAAMTLRRRRPLYQIGTGSETTEVQRL